MHAYAYIGPTDESLESAKNFAKEQKAIVRVEEVTKIAEIRTLISDTNLRYSSPIIYILKHFDKATEPAQNAFLKRLEEPQEHLTFILLAENENALLPTILSRVAVAYISKKSVEDTYSDSAFFKLEESERLATIAAIKKREDAQQFVKELLSIARSDASYRNSLDVLHSTMRALSQNGNPRIQLTHMVIQLQN